MKKEQKDSCHRLICKYRICPEGGRKTRLRNRIFQELQPFMVKWVSAILAKKSIYATEEEILSFSWDCFEFCLRRYKVNKPISVPGHFYSYTRFYLLKNVVYKEEGLEESNANIDSVEISPLNTIYEGLEELRSFRSILDPEYAMVFDDAIMSMHTKSKDKQYRQKESTLKQSKYKESKKLFKIMIDFLLRR